MPNQKLKKNRLIGRTLFTILLIAIVLFIYYVMGSPKQKVDEGIDENRSVRLKVAYEHADGFMSNYGKAFSLRYPNISFEVVTAAPGENLLSILEPEGVARMLEEEQVDLLWMNAKSYELASLDGRLAMLDGWMAQDRLDLEGIDPAVLTDLRQRSGGRLYGLPLEVDRMALYYNTELFEAYGVPFPTDRMSWEDILQLAARFPTTDGEGWPLYGLSVSYPSSPGTLIDLMERTNQLQMLDPVRKTFTLESASWQHVWELVLDRFKRGTVLWEDQPGRKDLFLQKQVAMTLQSSSFMNRLLQPGTNLAWDVVTEPVHPEFPDRSSTFDIPRIVAIRAQSPNQREAWEFLKMINSKAMLQKQVWTTDYDFLASNKLLLDLSTPIKRSGFDLDPISPVVVTYLKSATNDGGLYGLTRSFTSNVLVYNKELFERYGLAEPTGSMSWEQLYKLMDHFNRIGLAGERIYGYEAPNNMHPFHFVQTIASSGGLSFVHVETRQVTMNTTGWRNAIQLVTDAISSGALGGKRAQEGARNYMTEANLFARGKAALKDGNFQTVSEWINNPPSFRWGITGAVAYKPSEEATASLFSSNEIFAISAKADHKDNAWRVIQYLNSDELARSESGIRNGMLPARQDYAPEIAGHDVGLFYRIASPGPSVKRDPLFDFLALPEAFTKVMASIILEEFDSVLDGKSTVKEALERMQLREQAALDAAVAEESKR